MTRRSLALVVIAAVLCSAAVAGCGGPQAAGAVTERSVRTDGSQSIRVEGAWAQHTALAEGERLVSGATSAVYLRIENTGQEPDALVGLRTDVAQSARLHQTIIEGDVMRMQPVDRIEIPPGGTAELGRGGYHAMLLGLTRNLVPGERFQAVLELEKAGEVLIEVEVRTG